MLLRHSPDYPNVQSQMVSLRLRVTRMIAFPDQVSLPSIIERGPPVGERKFPT